jgi:hypothetical protein
LAIIVFSFGLVVFVLPDVQEGTLGIGSICFLVVLGLTYLRILESKKREEEGVEQFQAVSNAIQTIKHNPRNLTKVVDYYVTPDGWFIKRSLLTFDFVHISNICWVYAKDVKHYTNFIPIHTEHVLVVKLESGKTLSHSYWKKARDERLGLLRQVAPWAIFGYSKELENVWRTDREAFAVEVDRRYRALAGRPRAKP